MSICSVTLLCLTVCDPMDCSLPGTSVLGISQARILEWVAISYSGDLPNPGIEPHLLHWLVGSLPQAPPQKPSTSVEPGKGYIDDDDNDDDGGGGGGGGGGDGYDNSDDDDDNGNAA